MNYQMQDFKAVDKPAPDGGKRVEFSFALEDMGPSVAWPLDGKPIVNATARITGSGQLLVSAEIIESPAVQPQTTEQPEETAS